MLNIVGGDDGTGLAAATCGNGGVFARYGSFLFHKALNAGIPSD